MIIFIGLDVPPTVALILGILSVCISSLTLYFITKSLKGVGEI